MIRRMCIVFLSIFVLTQSLCGCKSTDIENSSSESSYYLNVNEKDYLTVNIGVPYKLNVETNDPTITFISANTNVATVDGNGVVTTFIAGNDLNESGDGYLYEDINNSTEITIKTANAGSKTITVIGWIKEYNASELLEDIKMEGKIESYSNYKDVVLDLNINAKYIGEKTVIKSNSSFSFSDKNGDATLGSDVSKNIWNFKKIISYNIKCPINKGNRIKNNYRLSYFGSIYTVHIKYIFHFSDGTAGYCTWSISDLYTQLKQ